jgi:hypothetical protein
MLAVVRINIGKVCVTIDPEEGGNLVVRKVI